MIRIYSEEKLADKVEFELSKETSHHVATVLRCSVGDAIVLFDGSGFEYSAVIIAIEKKQVRVKFSASQRLQCESPLKTELGQGISRGDRMDYVLQKAVELGVTHFTPLFTERCNVKLTGDRLERRLAHWRGVMIAACEQSGRVCLPIINKPQLLSEWLLLEKPGLKLVCSPTGGSLPIQSPLAVTLLIGPEGGLTETEVVKATESNFSPLKLGPRILRTETAAVVAMTVVQGKWGDLF